MSRGPTLVGRSAEVAALAALVEDLRRGLGGCAWIEGEPGIGKSALLKHCAALAEASGCMVSVGNAEELGWRSPLEAVRTILAADDTASLLDSAPHDIVVSRDPVMHATQSFLERIEAASVKAPVVVCLEDVQWADDASISLWRQLIDVAQQQRLLLIATSRLMPRSSAVEALRRRHIDVGATVVSLGPLPDTDVASLVATMVGATPGQQLLTLMAGAAGNPLVIEEIVETVLRNARLRSVGDSVVDLAEAASPPIEVLPSVHRAIENRLRLLSEDARSVMRAAAVAGTRFDVETVAALVWRTPEDLGPIVADARAAGVLVEHSHDLQFRHELLRHQLADELPSPVRCALQFQLARHLDTVGAPATVVAQHIMAAEEAVDYWLVRWLNGAGEALIYGTPQVALDLLTRAFAQLTPSPDDLERMRISMVRALYSLSQYDRLDRIASDVIESTRDRECIGEMTWYRGISLIPLGKVEQSLAVVDDALTGVQADARYFARLVALRADALSTLGRSDEAVQAAALALQVGRRCSDRVAVGMALNARSYVGLSRVEIARAMADAADGLEIVANDPECAEVKLSLLMSHLAAADAAADDAADTVASQLLSEGERSASPLGHARATVTVSRFWYERGRFDDAFASLTSLDLEVVPGSPSWAARAHGLMAAIAAHRGASELAGFHLRHVSAVETDAGANTVHAVLARSMVAEQNGDIAGAVAELNQRLSSGVDQHVLQALVWLPDLIRLALLTGDRALAGQATQLSEEMAIAAPFARARAVALRCGALFNGDADGCLESVALLEGMPWRYETARAHEDAAVLLATAGRVDQAKDHLRTATDLYAEMNAFWDARQAAARLRPLGVRLGARGPRRRAWVGWEALTPAEQRVATEVGAGRSNPEIAAALLLSRNTVETHVSHILVKLGVRSRRDIAQESISHASG